MFLLQRHWLHLTTALGLLCAALPGTAALGGLKESVYQDQQRLGTRLTVAATPGKPYTLYVLDSPDGVHIRQYVSTAGLVFAVAWDGPVLPDMEVLLGTYFSDYQDGLGHKSRKVHIRKAALVIESGGMMRAFAGKAYLPAQLPAPVVAHDIQ